jgi:hypothetical protein
MNAAATQLPLQLPFISAVAPVFPARRGVLMCLSSFTLLACRAKLPGTPQASAPAPTSFLINTTSLRILLYPCPNSCHIHSYHPDICGSRLLLFCCTVKHTFRLCLYFAFACAAKCAPISGTPHAPCRRETQMGLLASDCSHRSAISWRHLH